MTLIGRGVKPRDRWLSADYHISLSIDCGKMQTRSAEKFSNGGRFRFLTMNSLYPECVANVFCRTIDGL